jgi:hypothetical protein
MIEIQRTIKMANKTFFSILSIFKCNDVHRRTKIRIHKTVIRPTLLCGSLTWTLSQTEANVINSLERKILRRIFGPVNEQGLWRIRRNDELKQIYRELEISEAIRFKRLQWAGHVIRIEEYRIPKKAMQAQSGGRRTVGRPRGRWEDAVQVDVERLLGIRNWKTAARNREEWRKKCGEARARTGL